MYRFSHRYFSPSVVVLKKIAKVRRVHDDFPVICVHELERTTEDEEKPDDGLHLVSIV